MDPFIRTYSPDNDVPTPYGQKSQPFYSVAPQPCRFSYQNPKTVSRWKSENREVPWPAPASSQSRR